MTQPKIDNEYMRILLGDAQEMIDKARGCLIDTDRLEPEEIITMTIHFMDQARQRMDFVQDTLTGGGQ